MIRAPRKWYGPITEDVRELCMQWVLLTAKKRLICEILTEIFTLKPNIAFNAQSVTILSLFAFDCCLQKDILMKN